MKIKRLNDLGFTTSEIEYLVHHAQECFPVTEFDEEVERYLDAITKEEKCEENPLI